MNDLEIRIAQLTSAKRRWKTLAICMVAGACLFALISFVRARTMYAQAERMRAAALQAMAEIQADQAAQR